MIMPSGLVGGWRNIAIALIGSWVLLATVRRNLGKMRGQENAGTDWPVTILKSAVVPKLVPSAKADSIVSTCGLPALNAPGYYQAAGDAFIGQTFEVFGGKRIPQKVSARSSCSTNSMA